MIFLNFPLCPQHSISCLVTDSLPSTGCLAFKSHTESFKGSSSASNLSQLQNVLPHVSFIQAWFTQYTFRLLILKHISDYVKLKSITLTGSIPYRLKQASQLHLQSTQRSRLLSYIPNSISLFIFQIPVNGVFTVLQTDIVCSCSGLIFFYLNCSLPPTSDYILAQTCLLSLTLRKVLPTINSCLTFFHFYGICLLHEL